jgi:hypothetical protein
MDVSLQWFGQQRTREAYRLGGTGEMRAYARPIARCVMGVSERMLLIAMR